MLSAVNLIEKKGIFQDLFRFLASAKLVQRRKPKQKRSYLTFLLGVSGILRKGYTLASWSLRVNRLPLPAGELLG